MERKENTTGKDGTHTAEAENDKGGGRDLYGKFGDPESLLRAYESLQSEFTRRSQRLRAFERDAEQREKR
ncbi:MAG: hypothetical protein J5903_01310, partial [Clostridia bacterium]|nr:hypothetical protein [Clostridia bacterium]